jgi:hypothetical protein
MVKIPKKSRADLARENGKLGGRPKGALGKVNAAIKVSIRDAAAAYGPRMIEALAELAFNSESEAVRVSAIREILDRGFGRAPQPIDGDGDGGAIKMEISWLPSSE